MNFLQLIISIQQNYASSVHADIYSQRIARSADFNVCASSWAYEL
jgi:hypothetical protein